MGNQLFADEDECLCDSSNIDPAIISFMNKTPLFGFLTDKQKTRAASEVGETCEGVSLESTIKTGVFFEHRRNQMICLVLFPCVFFGDPSFS